MLDDTTVFLRRARQEAGNIDEGQDRDLEGIAEAHETRGLARAIDVEATRQHHRLVGDHADRLTLEPDETGDDVLREVFLNFVKIALVRGLQDQFLHVIGGVRVVGDQGVERIVDPARFVEERAHGGFIAVVEREEIDETSHFGHGFHVVLEGAIGDRGLARVGRGAAQFLCRHLFVRHGLHHVGAGHEHVGRIAHHEDEVGHRRRIDRATSARSHDHGNLGHHARGHDVALEHVGIARERGDAFLNARTARVVQADDRCAVLHGHVHDLADLFGMGFRQRAAKDGEILREHIDEAPVDRAPAGYDAVARILLALHPEVGAAVRLEGVELLEAALVQQQLDPFAGGQLALGVLGCDPFLAAAKPRDRATVLKLLQDVFHRATSHSSGPASGPGFSRNLRAHAASAKSNPANLQRIGKMMIAN